MGLRGGRNRKYTLAEKFEARVIRGAPDACWPIEGAKGNPAGHVHISTGSAVKPPYIRVYAHVYAWEQAHGRFKPAGTVVMHTCDNPRCCNPAHLQLGTQRENILDSIDKGRYNAFGRQKLNATKVHEIRAMAKAGELQRVIAAKFGIARHSVSAIVNNRSWQHLEARPFVVGRAVDDVLFERVPSVQLPIRGDLHVGTLPTAAQSRRLNSVDEVAS